MVHSTFTNLSNITLVSFSSKLLQLIADPAFQIQSAYIHSLQSFDHSILSFLTRILKQNVMSCHAIIYIHITLLHLPPTSIEPFLSNLIPPVVCS